MFDSHDKDKYNSQTAPQSLKARILADADSLAEQKAAPRERAKLPPRYVFMRYAASAAACLLVVVAIIFASRMDNSAVFIGVNGELLDRAGEKTEFRDTAAIYGRTIGTPAGIPVEIGGRSDDVITVDVESGALWIERDDVSLLTTPATLQNGDILYWLPDGNSTSTLTLTCGDNTAVYTMKIGENAEVRIIFEK